MKLYSCKVSYIIHKSPKWLHGDSHTLINGHNINVSFAFMRRKNYSIAAPDISFVDQQASGLIDQICILILEIHI